MNPSLSREVLVASLFVLLSAFVGLGPASAQEDDYLVGDVPEWLEDFGYEDTHGNGLLSPDAAEGLEGVRESAAPRTAASPSGQCDCLRCRDRLTGDWCGYRSCLRENGIAYRGRVTQFFFGVGGGVNPPVPDQFAELGIAGGDTFEYTGNSRHDFLVDLDKFGGLPHSRFVVTLENIWGRWGNVSFETGALAPAVFNAVMPVDHEAHGDVYCTNFLLIQPLSEQFIVSVGKTRLPGIADNNIFAGGDGSDQFVNQTFAINPLFVPQIPISTFAVAAVMPQDWGHVGLSVLDPMERSTEFMEFETLYSRGAIVLGQVQVDTNFFDKPGEHHVGGFYKNVDQLDLTFTPLPPEYPYPPAPPGTPKLLTHSGKLHDLLRLRSIRGHLRQPRLRGATRKVGGTSDGPVSPTMRQGIPTGQHGTSAPGSAAAVHCATGAEREIGSVSATPTRPHLRNSERFLKPCSLPGTPRSSKPTTATG